MNVEIWKRESRTASETGYHPSDTYKNVVSYSLEPHYLVLVMQVEPKVEKIVFRFSPDVEYKIKIVEI